MLGDGCLQEGISYEAAALAGHLKLGNLVYIYDSNSITIEGKTDLAWSEDVEARFIAAGWHVLKIDGHDYAQIIDALAAAKAEKERTTLIIATTQIAFGSPAEVEEILEKLGDKYPPMVIQLPKAPGTKEARYTHLMSGEAAASQHAFESSGEGAAPRGSRVGELEEEVRRLRQQLEWLTNEFEAFRKQFQ